MGSLRQVEKVVQGQKKMEGEPLALLLLMCLAMAPQCTISEGHTCLSRTQLLRSPAHPAVRPLCPARRKPLSHIHAVD